MNENIKEIIRKCIFVVCLIVFIYSIWNIGLYFKETSELKQSYESAQEYVEIKTPEKLSEIVVEKPLPTIETESNESNPIENTESIDPIEALEVEIDINWDKLKNEAKNLVGWLYIPNTNISYPLVQDKTSNQYYVRRDYTGKKNSGGSIFLNKETDIDDKHTIIYGHKMRADIMFHRLPEYAKQDFADSHKYIYIFTENGCQVYQVFSVVYADYWENTYTWDFEDENNLSFMEYINQEIDNSVIKTEVTNICESDKIISLSTCSGKTKVNRLVVHGVLIHSY